VLALGFACTPVRQGGTSDDDDSAGDDDDAANDDDAADDDDAVSNDDDAVPPGPYEGEWTGTAIGAVRFDTTEVACSGEVVIDIDGINRVTGVVDCPITGNPCQNCGFPLPDVGLLLDGPDALHLVGCTGIEFPGSILIVTDTFLQGVVQGVVFDEGLGLEVEVDFTYSVFR
jgi:hypothetical protein